MKPSKLLISVPIVLSAISGLLSILLFPPFGFHLLAWVAFVPLLYATAGKSPTEACKLGFITGLIYFGGVMPWIANVLVVYGHINIPLGLCLMLLLVFYLALYIAIFTWSVAWFGRGAEVLLYAPFLFVVFEYIRGHLLSGLPWALLAHSQHGKPTVIQIASITGTAGVTFLIMLVNSALAYSLVKWREGEKHFALPAGAILLAVANLFWGNAEINKINESGGRSLNVALVQGNIDQGRKWDPAFREETLNRYFTMTREAATENTDLIVWPETAAPFFFGRDAEYSMRLRKLVNEISVPILFGSMGAELTDDLKGYVYFNRAHMVAPNGKEEHYDKVHLVPFGEYVPFRKWMSFVEKITDAVPGDIATGTNTDPIDIGGVPVGVQICYEIIFAEPARSFRRNGAELMINITNDAWFGRMAASAQHMMSLPFRAVENRMPVVRAANTGISGFVTAVGEIKKSTGLFETRWVKDTVVIPAGGMTFYTRFGDIFTFLCATGIFATIIRLKIRKREK